MKEELTSLLLQILCAESSALFRFSMSATDMVRRNKTAILTTLCGDYRLILNKVHENKLITKRDYNNLKSINKEDVEGHVIKLVDKIMYKGENTCKAFLDLLQTDEDIKTTYPELKNIQLQAVTTGSKPPRASRPRRPGKRTASVVGLDEKEISALSSKPGSGDTATPSGGATGGDTTADGKHFVDKHRTKLIERVSNIAIILDELLEQDVLQQEMYDKIRLLPTCQEKMRELYSGPLKASGVCKDKFYKILEEKERYLVDELKKMK